MSTPTPVIAAHLEDPFIDKNTEFHMTIIGTYMPQENSFHGRDRNVVFNYINALFDQYQDESDILL